MRPTPHPINLSFELFNCEMEKISRTGKRYLQCSRRIFKSFQSKAFSDQSARIRTNRNSRLKPRSCCCMLRRRVRKSDCCSALTDCLGMHQRRSPLTYSNYFGGFLRTALFRSSLGLKLGLQDDCSSCQRRKAQLLCSPGETGALREAYLHG